MDKRIEIPISQDSEGFVRRACPACEREFKWLYTAHEDEATQPEAGGFYCPYCSEQAQPDQWFTPTQVEYIRQVGLGHVAVEVDEMFARFNHPGSGLSYTPGDRPSAPPEPPAEPDDLNRVELACHRKDPVKVEEGWSGPVHCLICGASRGA